MNELINCKNIAMLSENIKTLTDFECRTNGHQLAQLFFYRIGRCISLFLEQY